MVSFTTVEIPAPAAALDIVRLSNGVTLHYASQGPRTGSAVILIHGYSDSWFSFSRILPLLPPALRVICARHARARRLGTAAGRLPHR